MFPIRNRTLLHPLLREDQLSETTCVLLCCTTLMSKPLSACCVVARGSWWHSYIHNAICISRRRRAKAHGLPGRACLLGIALLRLLLVLLYKLLCST